jgi:peroxiredoxin (alkyl hydroperoxide reductase subunit C)
MENYMLSLIRQSAPDFSAEAVLADNTIVSNFKLSDFRGKYVILLFYPLDFTFVCPTEILAFNEKLEDFRSRDTELIGISVDSVYTHLAWKKTPVNEGGIGNIAFTLVSDLKKEIATNYGVLIDGEKALRALFLIDKEGIVRHCIINDTPYGRNVNEALRMVDALRHYDKYGKLCPANWEEGKESMEDSTDGVIDYLSKYASKK